MEDILECRSGTIDASCLGESHLGDVLLPSCVTLCMPFCQGVIGWPSLLLGSPEATAAGHAARQSDLNATSPGM